MSNDEIVSDPVHNVDVVDSVFGGLLNNAQGQNLADLGGDGNHWVWLSFRMFDD